MGKTKRAAKKSATPTAGLRTFTKMAAQGDLLIRRIDEIPAGVTASKPCGGRHIVAHSETGHHHYLAAIGSEYFTTQDPTIAYLRCSSPAELLHDRPHDTHAPIALEVGSYELRRQREYTPEGWRRVED